MKRVAIYIPTLKSGGAEKQAAILAAMLSEKHDVHLITLNMQGNDQAINLDRLKPTSVVRHYLSGNVFAKARQLKRIFLDNDIEILFNYLTYPDILGSYVGKKVGVPKIYNGIRNSQLPKLKFLCERFAHNHLASATIFNCYSGAEHFKGMGFSNGKCIVIPNCYPEVSPVVHRGDRPVKTIITVGRFVSQKDYLTAIRAMAELKQRQDFRFHIVGYGELENQIRQWIQEYGIEQNTTIYINPDNIPELLRNADIYLSTSLFEGTSNSIMEALDFSLPVVCTDVGDNSYLVRDAYNGYLHAIGDYKGISASIATLLDNSDMRVQLGENGNGLLKENFSPEVFLRRYSELI
jgi:glycosyltransferase involved in cell wall biosynthesis